jgi:hypothetical protein
MKLKDLANYGAIPHGCNRKLRIENREVILMKIRNGAPTQKDVKNEGCSQ